MTKEEKLLYAIGEIEDELIVEADAPAPKNIKAFPMSKRWKKVMLSAACFLLCIGAWASVGGMFRMGNAAPSAGVENAKPAAPAEALIQDSAAEECIELEVETEVTVETPAEAPAAKAEEAAPESAGAVKCPVDGSDEVFYINYQAPVLQLDLSGDSEGIIAKRQLNIDLSPDNSETNSWDFKDCYTLKNSADVDKTVTLNYHFSGNFYSVDSVSMEIDGSSQDQCLDASLSYNGFTDDGMNIDHFNNWNDWIKKFPEEVCSVNDEIPSYANELITVYELYDAEVSDNAPKSACIAVEFECDEETVIWNNNFNGMGIHGTERIYDVFATAFSHRPNMNKSLWVFGGKELRNIEIKGYTNGACEVEYDGVTAKLRSYQTTLKDAISQSVYQFAEENNIDLKHLDKETIANAVLAYLKYSSLGEEPQPRYDYLSSWELYSDVMAVERIYTLEQTVTIPANNSTKVEVQLQRKPNWTLESDRTRVDILNTGAMGLRYDSFTINIEEEETKRIIEGNLIEGENHIDPTIEHWYAVFDGEEVCDGVPLRK